MGHYLSEMGRDDAPAKPHVPSGVLDTLRRMADARAKRIEALRARVRALEEKR